MRKLNNIISRKVTLLQKAKLRYWITFLTRHLCVSTDGSTFYVNDTPHAGNGDNASVEEDKTHHGSATLPGGCSLGSTQSAAAMKFPSEEGSECSSVTSESGPGSRGQPHTCHSNNAALSLKSIFAELQEHRENLDRMREKLDSVKVCVQLYLNTSGRERLKYIFYKEFPAYDFLILQIFN